jgi:hypothetical protein
LCICYTQEQPPGSGTSEASDRLYEGRTTAVLDLAVRQAPLPVVSPHQKGYVSTYKTEHFDTAVITTYMVASASL